MKKVVLLMLACLMIGVVALGGCSSSKVEDVDEAPETVSAADEPEVEEAEETASLERDLIADYAKITSDEKLHIDPDEFVIGEGADQLTIGIAMGTIGSSFFKNLADAAKRVVEENGGIALVSDAGTSFETQVNQIEDFITQGVDGIIIDPCDPVASVESALDKAAEAGIPVVSADSSLSLDYTNCLGNYCSDNYAIGKQVGVYTAQRLIEKNGSVTGTVAVLDGVEGIIPAVARYDGFWDAIEEADPDHTLEEVCHLYGGSWTEEAGIQTAGDALVANPDVDVIFGIADPFVVAATAELERIGKLDSGVFLVACDGAKSALKLINDGGAVEAVGMNHPIWQGEGAASLMLSYLTTGYLPESRTIAPIPVAATPENISEIYDPNSSF